MKRKNRLSLTRTSSRKNDQMDVTEHKKREPEIQEGCQGLATAARVGNGSRDGAGGLCIEYATEAPRVCILLSPHPHKSHLQRSSRCPPSLTFEPLNPWAPGINTLVKAVPPSFLIFHVKSGRRANLLHNVSQKTHLVPSVSHELVAEHSHLHKVLCIKIGSWTYSWQMVLNIEPVTDWPHCEAPLLLV